MHPPSKKYLVLFLLSLVIAGVFFFWPDFQTMLATAPIPANTGSPQPASLPPWLAVYFTDPNLAAEQGQEGIDQYVVAAIGGASKTIDVASFDFNLPRLVDALTGASLRGVRVRVVYDGVNGNLELDNQATDNKPFYTLLTLENAGVGLVNGSRSAGLMHDKMMIIDGNTLFTGSWNLSYNDTYRNNNNLLEITAPGLVANYQAKFTEMFVEGRFGSNAQVKIPNPELVINGVQVETYMAPEDGVMAKLIKLVEGARKSIHFMAFTFTHEDLAKAMIDRAQDKIDVQGVIEENNAYQGSLEELYCAGLPVRTDGNPYVMHHKVIIIDSETVITGSFNFTWSADTENDENVLVIHSPGVAAAYEQEYQKLYAAGHEPQLPERQCRR